MIADRFYPSSKLFSNCGHQQKMPLHLRTYKCHKCGFTEDRNFNAAVNLKKYVHK
ncbi:zinc ribbon domain-containing protein [Dapis sp. BLCC M229]|uniref:zinc ribbon domain-containing protein n=1 Tax=Dapis sp. BLCC M229 TaxID=3400188 RepID=UPI003CF41E29